jgi:hypothetical protein
MNIDICDASICSRSSSRLLKCPEPVGTVSDESDPSNPVMASTTANTSPWWREPKRKRSAESDNAVTSRICIDLNQFLCLETTLMEAALAYCC